MSCQNVIAQVTRGSDFSFHVGFRNVDEAGVKTPKDLTGYTASFLDVAASLVGRLNSYIPDPLTGDVIVEGEGTPLLAIGQHSFRVMVTGPVDQNIATPLLVILVS